jgi:hypothetical protein
MWRSTANPEFRALADEIVEEVKKRRAPDDARAWLALAAEERETLATQP